jgi:hypothetical protein
MAGFNQVERKTDQILVNFIPNMGNKVQSTHVAGKGHGPPNMAD